MTELFIQSNITRLEQNFIRWSEKVPDMTDAFNKFIPQFQKTRGAWIKAGRTVDGDRYAPLTERYKIRKQKLYGNKPILIASGRLYNAVTGNSKMGMGWRQEVKPKSLEIEINLPYASYPQDMTRGKQRNYFLTKRGTLTMIDFAQLIQALEGNIDIQTEAILNQSLIDLARG